MSEPTPPNEGALRPWDALRFPDFRYLWASNFLVVVALWMRILVTAQWLLDETGSAAAVGLIGPIQLVVQIPALLWGGAIADHLNRKWVITGAQLWTFAVLLGLGVLDTAGMLQTWEVYVAVGATAVSQMVSNPAAAALAPSTVPERYLMHAITTNNATQNVAMIVGPLLFAGVAKFSGLTAAFYVGAAVALGAAVVPHGIRIAGRAAETSAGSTLRRVRDGFVYVVRHPILPGLFLLDTGITVVTFYREILPALVRGLFQGGAGTTGVLGAANSAGAFGGSFLALWLAEYRAKGMLVLYASLAYSVFLFGFSAFSILWVGVIFIALVGGADSVTVAVRHTTVQLTTPDNMRGRAHSFMVLSATTANNIGTTWVGFSAEWIGARETLFLGSVLAVLATLAIGRIWRPIREYRG